MKLLLWMIVCSTENNIEKNNNKTYTEIYYDLRTKYLRILNENHSQISITIDQFNYINLNRSSSCIVMTMRPVFVLARKLDEQFEFHLRQMSTSTISKDHIFVDAGM